MTVIGMGECEFAGVWKVEKRNESSEVGPVALIDCPFPFVRIVTLLPGVINNKERKKTANWRLFFIRNVQRQTLFDNFNWKMKFSINSFLPKRNQRDSIELNHHSSQTTSAFRDRDERNLISFCLFSL